MNYFPGICAVKSLARRVTTTESSSAGYAFSCSRKQNHHFLDQKPGVLRNGGKWHVLGWPTIIIIKKYSFNNNNNKNNNNNNNNINHSTHCVTAFYFPQDEPPQCMDYTPFRGIGSRSITLLFPFPATRPIRSRNIITWSPGTGRYP